MPSSEQYQKVARRIAGYLAARQQPDGGFPGPDNYGVATALWLWSSFGEEFRRQVALAKCRLEIHPPAGHGEFNAYALLQCRERVGAEFADRLLRGICFGSRHSANWMLLRAICRSHSGSPVSAARGRFEARAALARYMRRGFVADRGGVRSFAYHCFCGALLADLWRCRGYRWAAAAAAQAAQFISRFILPNGDTLYIGRGQEQIFGYGALLYLLEAAAEISGNAGFREHADRVFGYLLSFQRDDGSFPLVLGADEEPEPWAPEQRPGWYSYNRYADYLPFLGCMLLKAADPRVSFHGDVPAPSQHPDFHTHREERYVAGLSRPGGATTNDLVFPYVCVDGVSLFPCYGAERNAAPETLPLPFGVLEDGRAYGFRDHLTYRLNGSCLVGQASWGSHEREFEFGADGFTCRDRITFRRERRFEAFVAANLLFRNVHVLGDGSFEACHRSARAVVWSDRPTRVCADVGASASGRLCALQYRLEPFHAKVGEVIAVETRVQFL